MKILVYDEYYGDMGCLYRNNYDDYHIIELKNKYKDNGKIDLDDLVLRIGEEWIKVSRFESKDVSIKDGDILNYNGRSIVKWIILPEGDNNSYFQEIIIKEGNGQ